MGSALSGLFQRRKDRKAEWGQGCKQGWGEIWEERNRRERESKGKLWTKRHLRERGRAGLGRQEDNYVENDYSAPWGVPSGIPIKLPKVGQGELPTPSHGRLQITDVAKECGLWNDTDHQRTLTFHEASGQRFSNFLITGHNP